MKRKVAYFLIILSSMSLAFVLKPARPIDKGFAIVELFTSEGCSSCPPADVLLAKIEKESKDKPIYLLAYHVDYWDKLGWKDTFSNPKNSARQSQYANWLNLNTVYTPQIIVNGSKEFVGSQENTLRSAISSALSEQQSNTLEVTVEKQNSGSLSLSYRTGESSPVFNLVVALVSPTATNKIARGENRGRILSHVQIVRKFESFKMNGKENGSVNFLLEKEDLNDEAEVIAFLQNVKNGKIAAVTKLKIKAPSIN